MPRVRIPLMFGNVIEVLGIILGLLLIAFASDVSNDLLKFILYLVSGGCLVFFPHSLTHFVVGRMVGVKFVYYFLGRSAIGKLRIPVISQMAGKLPVLTLRVDPVSLSHVSRGGRCVMFASGAIVSMILPFFPVVASIGRISTTLSVILIALSVGNVAFDLYYSPKAGDIARAKKSIQP